MKTSYPLTVLCIVKENISRAAERYARAAKRMDAVRGPIFEQLSDWEKSPLCPPGAPGAIPPGKRGFSIVIPANSSSCLAFSKRALRMNLRIRAWWRSFLTPCSWMNRPKSVRPLRRPACRYACPPILYQVGGRRTQELPGSLGRIMVCQPDWRLELVPPWPGIEPRRLHAYHCFTKRSRLPVTVLSRMENWMVPTIFS